MSEHNKQYAYFSLHGDFDPATITSRVGVKPTEIWRKGDLHPRNRLERKLSHWALKSRLSHTDSIESHISDVLSQLRMNEIEFIKISKEFGGCMQVVGYLHDGYPGLNFSPELVIDLAKFQLSIDFDLYNLWSDAREDT